MYKGKPIKEIAQLTDKDELNKIQRAFDNLTEAKKIASDMKLINDGEGAIDPYRNPTKWIYPKEILNKFSSLAGQTVTSTASYSKIPPLKPSRSELLSNMTKKVNALGYKVLPNFDIEKM